jgi:hypothetical protein
MEAHRRHRKASPKPTKRLSDSSIDHDSYKETGGVGGGMYSYFAKARRRWGRSHRETDTLLPTTYANNNTPKRSVNPTAKNCNSFLMGGHYYPGKDKKRRHMRKRTLWYKIFCSSNCRRLASFFLVAYVVLWHAILPLGGWVWQWGINLSKSGSRTDSGLSDWLQYDATLVVPSIHDEQNSHLKLASERGRLQFGVAQRNALRLQLLKNIVPAWYHRNDKVEEPLVEMPEQQNDQEIPKDPLVKRSKRAVEPLQPPKADPVGHSKTPPDIVVSNDKVNQTKPVERKVEKAMNTTLATTANKRDPPFPKSNNADTEAKQLQPQQIQQKHPKNSTTTTTTSERVLRMTGKHLPVRTLHNMDAFANQYSKCPSALSNTNEPSEWATTLVVQTSVNRLWILNETCTRWKDPIIAVVFVPHDQQQQQQEIELHVACPHVQIIEYLANEQESSTDKYPVNRLRNIGLDAVSTSHVLVMDVDFVPSHDLATTIRKALQHRHATHPDGEDRQALIVPAFERLPPKPCETESACAAYLQSNSSFIPSSFPDVQNCLQSEECIVFQSKVNWEGHYSTRSEHWLQRKWYDDEEETVFRRLPCFHTARYEPYVVLRWCPPATIATNEQQQQQPVAHYYDERFYGYGKNKIELVSHLRKSGYTFSILPEGFLVHNPHPESSVKQAWNDKKGSDLHSSMDMLYVKFLMELESKYKDIHNSTVQICKAQ